MTFQSVNPTTGEVLDTFEEYLATWRGVAEAEAQFVWAARAAPAEVHRLLDAWATMDRIPDDRMRSLGLDWSSPRGRVFFQAMLP